MLDSTRAEHTRIDVEEINHKARTNPRGLVRDSEIRYVEQVDFVASEVMEQSKTHPFLMLAGPSASTKTTTALKIAERLLEAGLDAITISMDDFYFDRDKLPLLENGDIDYETVNTLDLVKFNECITQLNREHFCDFPIFDFKTGCRSAETERIEMGRDTVVIIEGIHALNPTVLSKENAANCLKLYVSPHSDYYYNGEALMTARSLRFVRRAVRDYFYRGSSINNTVDMWENVVASEIVNIMPYRVNADYKIDSTIMYEPCIYVSYLRKMLETHEELNEESREHVDRAFEQLLHFYRINPQLIPSDTVLNEFLM